ncbi:hypothetical protein CXG81DRAFT_27109 [Caulochytrium protostelioides]|uniref:Uncharacterized protein n=1 Tax=Caulochytrium protostelioides TaxID=1555241 RepID=A0A4P9X590_9FUNG|nr:hypothetical protein CXG81DRAFT_27109 [Caulochytrium protostelioides]|eukprot:RKP00180.1 hypothetical protein CXG81DRAFT_27109 [Caulochytrium protostelioides]
MPPKATPKTQASAKTAKAAVVRPAELLASELLVQAASEQALRSHAQSDEHERWVRQQSRLASATQQIRDLEERLAARDRELRQFVADADADAARHTRQAAAATAQLAQQLEAATAQNEALVAHAADADRRHARALEDKDGQLDDLAVRVGMVAVEVDAILHETMTHVERAMEHILHVGIAPPARPNGLESAAAAAAAPLTAAGKGPNALAAGGTGAPTAPGAVPGLPTTASTAAAAAAVATAGGPAPTSSAAAAVAALDAAALITLSAQHRKLINNFRLEQLLATWPDSA